MKCDKCGCTVGTEASKRAHERVCDGESDRGRVDDILDSIDYDRGDYYVYVLRISDGGDSYYYVGCTAGLRERLLSHIGNSNTIAFPKDGGLSKCSSYTVDEVVEVEPVDGGEYVAKNRERERGLELAIEEETTKILGGR